MLKEIIDKFYLDRENSRDRDHFYVTDAGRCPRSVFFKFKNAPRKAMEANILRLFDHGDYIHRLIMNSLVSTRDIHIVSSEVNIPPQETISGRADAIISDGTDLYVLDIKSMNSFVFRTLTDPKKGDMDQIQMYLHYFKIPRGILLYVNKDTQQLKEFIVDYDKKMVTTLLGDLDGLKKKIDSDIVPGRIDDYPKDSQCRYCQFKGICILNEEGDMEWKKYKEKISFEAN